MVTLNSNIRFELFQERGQLGFGWNPVAAIRYSQSAVGVFVENLFKGIINPVLICPIVRLATQAWNMQLVLLSLG